MLSIKGNRVLVLPIEPTNKLSSGLVIPDSAKEPTLQATVISVGDGAYEDGIFVKPDVKAGDVLLHKKYAGDEFFIDGVKHFIIPYGDILAVVE